MGKMSDKNQRVQKHVDEFITSVADRWETACKTNTPELLEGLPLTEGDITIEDIISELRTRASDIEIDEEAIEIGEYDYDEFDEDEDNYDNEEETAPRNPFIRWLWVIGGFCAMVFFWQGPEPFFRTVGLIDRRGVTEGVQSALGNRIDREDPWWVRMDSLRTEAEIGRIRYEHAWDDYWANRGTPFPEPEKQ